MISFGQLTSDRLDEFVDKTDELGGPDSLDAHSFWQGLSYSPKQFIDETLDPFLNEYVGQQVALYSEISGRPLNQSANELTGFDFAKSLGSANPMGEYQHFIHF